MKRAELTDYIVSYRHTHTHTHNFLRTLLARSFEDNGLQGNLAYTHRQDYDQIWIKVRPAGMID